MLKIKDQATELIDQLTKNLSSMDIILGPCFNWHLMDY
jgi:hypothetical protein